MKIALFGTNQIQFSKVYTPAVLQRLSEYGELSKKINKSNLEENAEFLADCEFAFSTWGMPQFTKEEIAKYMPKLKAVFYSAGTVQYFAKPFLESGVKVFSAFAANAVPVAEYTFAQITLAAKGYFQSAKYYRILPLLSYKFANTATGNFECKVGLIGLGAIGKMVADKLKALDVKVYGCDPFVSKEAAKELGVTLVDMETIFNECDIISNHLANKTELENIFNMKLFKRMKKHSTFINTGRGAQVAEYQLALSLLLHPSRTFVADVLKRETFPYISPIFWVPNAIITPHIAGSTGKEPQRMAYYMMEEMERFIANEPARYEVTLDSLARMA
ncbi:MAG: hydroxyacid dehydrogenase [Clostridia bacterium]|nr:hydroxyacid dehydrogenase [Clostridia bacterium]MBR6620466.1 hydroxyacid dehydrogenase [Clostridia bacterium]